MIQLPALQSLPKIEQKCHRSFIGIFLITLPDDALKQASKISSV